MGRANGQADQQGDRDRPIAERYRDGRRLKVGQGIETWLAVDEDGREVVARAAPLRAVGAAARKWLEIEIELLNQLTSPPADGAPTRRAGRLTLGVEGDSLVLVRPFVPGMTLKERLAGDPLSIDEVIDLGAQLARALEEAHARGVVHGDLKPSNVVLSEGGPVVVDFGLARHAFLGDGRDELAVDGVRYLAPEQSGLLERGVDARADLYSLGVMLHEAVTGRPPFEGRDVADLLHRQLMGPPPPLPAPAPRALDRVVTRLLRMDARDRYQTARGVRADLEELASARAANEPDPDVVIGARDARDSLTEPAFTGRRDELAALERAIDGARDDRGRLVLLEGESGAGKTWLLEELSRRIGLRPVWLLRGHGAAQVPPRPFQLVARVAREIAAGAPPGSGRATRIAAGVAGVERAIAASLPALAALVGGEGAAAPASPEPGALPDPKAEDRTLYALSALLDSLGSPEEPAILLFDDAQWADAQTLRLLDRWSGQGRALPHVVVVLAFRSEEVAEGHPLRKLGGAEHVRIPRFAPAEVR